MWLPFVNLSYTMRQYKCSPKLSSFVKICLSLAQQCFKYIIIPYLGGIKDFTSNAEYKIAKQEALSLFDWDLMGSNGCSGAKRSVKRTPDQGRHSHQCMDNFPHFSITFIAALLPCFQSFTALPKGLQNNTKFAI